MQKSTMSSILSFLLFLFHPEDSSSTSTRGRVQPRDWPHQRVAGAVKILFWIVVAILFWTAIPILSDSLKHCL